MRRKEAGLAALTQAIVDGLTFDREPATIDLDGPSNSRKRIITTKGILA